MKIIHSLTIGDNRFGHFERSGITEKNFRFRSGLSNRISRSKNYKMLWLFTFQTHFRTSKSKHARCKNAVKNILSMTARRFQENVFIYSKIISVRIMWIALCILRKNELKWWHSEIFHIKKPKSRKILAMHRLQEVIERKHITTA